MIHLTHQTPIWLAVQPVDFRKGIDGLVAICRDVLAQSPQNGHYFVFINRDHSRIRVLSYDGTGYWLMTKRLSQGRFIAWPRQGVGVTALQARRLRTLLSGQPLDDAVYVVASCAPLS